LCKISYKLFAHINNNRLKSQAVIFYIYPVYDLTRTLLTHVFVLIDSWRGRPIILQYVATPMKWSLWCWCWCCWQAGNIYQRTSTTTTTKLVQRQHRQATTTHIIIISSSQLHHDCMTNHVLQLALTS